MCNVYDLCLASGRPRAASSMAVWSRRLLHGMPVPLLSYLEPFVPNLSYCHEKCYVSTYQRVIDKLILQCQLQLYTWIFHHQQRFMTHHQAICQTEKSVCGGNRTHVPGLDRQCLRHSAMQIRGRSGG